MRERERERERKRHRQREKQAPCREPDARLEPGTPGSYPELKADTQPLSGSLSLCLNSPGARPAVREATGAPILSLPMQYMFTGSAV